MPILKISGNYMEIATLLDLAFLYKSDDLSKYQHQIALDLNRVNYLSADKTVKEMQQALSDITPLSGKPYSYTQGNFNATAFNESYMKKKEHFISRILDSKMRGEADGYGTIETAYETNGSNCGIAITYLRDDPNPNSKMPTPPEKRKQPFILTVIENTALAPDDRTVSCFIDINLIPENLKHDLLKHGAIIQDLQLAPEIQNTVKQKYVSDLFTNLITAEGSVALEPFKALQARFVPGYNLDNRDIKREKLDELIHFLKVHLPENESIRNYLEQKKSDFLNDLNLAKNDIFKPFIDDLCASVLSQCQQSENIDQAFIQRLNYEVYLTQLIINIEIIASTLPAEHKACLLLQADLLRNKRDDKRSVFEQFSLEELVQTAPITFKPQAEFNQRLKSLEKQLDHLVPFQKEQIQRILTSQITLTFNDQNEEIKSALLSILKCHVVMLENPLHFSYESEMDLLFLAIRHSECPELIEIGASFPNFVDSVLLTTYQRKIYNLENKLAKDDVRTPEKSALYQEIARLLLALHQHENIKERFEIINVIERTIDWEQDQYSQTIIHQFNNIRTNYPNLSYLSSKLDNIQYLSLDIDYKNQLNRLESHGEYPLNYFLQDVIDLISTSYRSSPLTPELRQNLNQFLRSCADFLDTQNGAAGLNRAIIALQNKNVPLPNLIAFQNIADFKKQNALFDIKLTTLNTPPGSEKKIAVYQQGLKIKECLRAILRNNFHILDKTSQAEITTVLKYCSDCENPTSLRELIKLNKNIALQNRESREFSQLTNEIELFTSLALDSFGLLKDPSSNKDRLIIATLSVIGVSVVSFATLGLTGTTALIGYGLKAITAAAKAAPTVAKMATAVAGAGAAGCGFFKTSHKTLTNDNIPAQNSTTPSPSDNDPDAKPLNDTVSTSAENIPKP